ncbi:MAG: tetratricopeptide repeat protein [Planctomycetota bacterium]|jgi:hypothetical protein
METAFLLFFITLAVSFAVGTTIRLTLVYTAHDDNRWRNFTGFLGDLADNRLTRPLFTVFLGRRLTHRALEAYVRKEEFGKAGDLALAEGMVDDAIEIMNAEGWTREAARLAMRTGRTARAQRLYRTCIDRSQKKDRLVLAAEMADEAGFWQEAVTRLRSLDTRRARMRAASLAAQHGDPRHAVEILAEEDSPLDAMRVIRDAGHPDFVISHCRESDDPVLHHFGAETARRMGKPEIGVDLLLAHGHLKDAAQFAQDAGLMERAMELYEKVRKEERSKKAELYEKGWGNFGLDMPDQTPGGPRPEREELEDLVLDPEPEEESEDSLGSYLDC